MKLFLYIFFTLIQTIRIESIIFWILNCLLLFTASSVDLRHYRNTKIYQDFEFFGVKVTQDDLVFGNLQPPMGGEKHDVIVKVKIYWSFHSIYSTQWFWENNLKVFIKSIFQSFGFIRHVCYVIKVHPEVHLEINPKLLYDTFVYHTLKSFRVFMRRKTHFYFYPNI